MVIMKGIIWFLNFCQSPQPLFILEMLMSESINNAQLTQIKVNHLVFHLTRWPSFSKSFIHPKLNRQKGAALWSEGLCVCACTLDLKRKARDG